MDKLLKLKTTKKLLILCLIFPIFPPTLPIGQNAFGAHLGQGPRFLIYPIRSLEVGHQECQVHSQAVSHQEKLP